MLYLLEDIKILFLAMNTVNEISESKSIVIIFISNIHIV